ncbi:MFS transporter [Neisseriaceae bacterium TC5R-5]|nr:MFS transporter [Neisseriaceae bacterium TC5R-5]
MMPSTPAVLSVSESVPVMPSWLVFFLACVCGLIVANIYYAQPLIGPIARTLGMSASAAGLIVTLTQLGYVVGLLFLVPLGDLFENRKLAITVMSVSAVGLLACSLASSPGLFLGASLLVGLGSVTVQILVPYAAHLAPEAMRGRVVGNVMSGLMLGIMLSRPVASFITDLSSWRVVFVLSFGLMVILALLLRRLLPPRPVHAKLHYGELLASMLQLALHTPVLQRRGLYHACMFAAFSLFWTTVPLLLAGPLFGLSDIGIALFALAGVAGAVAAPLAGRVADRGWTRAATAFALLSASAAFLLTHLGTLGSGFSLGCLVAAAILLDFAVSANLVLGQRVIFTLNPAYRARLNGLYMATFFCGGAFGSAVSTYIFTAYGWQITSLVGMLFPALAFVYFLTERRG